MHIAVIHDISDPEQFWAGEPELPEGTTLPTVLPNQDGTRAICVWESDSVDTVRDLVESATSAIARNQYFEIDSSKAMGLPS